MRTKTLLLECKVRLKLESDYALAQALDIPKQRISEYMKGERTPDEYACFRIAETLHRDPASIIAEIKADVTGKHKAYFKDFIQRRGMLILLGGLSLSSYSDSYATGATAANSEPVRIMLGYGKRRRCRLRQLDKATRTRFGGFFCARG